MFFKKKKKEEVKEIVSNPFSDIGLNNGQEIESVTEVPIVNNPVINSQENLVSTGNINEPVKEEIVYQENSVVEETEQPEEDFNEIHPITAEALESIENVELVDLKDIDVDELIKDVKVVDYCPNCGSEIESYAEVCPLCGTSIE